MYESYEELMERKLAMTQDKRDRRQGSLIFDAMGPNAGRNSGFLCGSDHAGKQNPLRNGNWG